MTSNDVDAQPTTTASTAATASEEPRWLDAEQQRLWRAYLDGTVRFIESLGQIAVVDGASQGLVLIDLAGVRIARAPYF